MTTYFSDGAFRDTLRRRWPLYAGLALTWIFLGMLVAMDLTADYAKITCPTLFLAGKHDGLRPPPTVEPLSKLVKGARFEALETAHFMSQQTPELVADRMTRFLSEHGC